MGVVGGEMMPYHPVGWELDLLLSRAQILTVPSKVERHPCVMQVNERISKYFCTIQAILHENENIMVDVGVD